MLLILITIVGIELTGFLFTAFCMSWLDGSEVTCVSDALLLSVIWPIMLLILALEAVSAFGKRLRLKRLQSRK